MKFRTLHELGHDEKTITLIDDLSRQGSSSQPNGRGSGRDIILIPHPTNDINDPLRFPAWKKWAIFTNVLVLTFMCNAWLGGLAPAFYLLTQEFNISVAASTNLLIWPLLAAGLCVSRQNSKLLSLSPSFSWVHASAPRSLPQPCFPLPLDDPETTRSKLTCLSSLQNFFWVPTADYIGRRPVFVICALVTFACQIWAAASQSYGSLLAARVVGSFTASCHEALGAVIVNVRYIFKDPDFGLRTLSLGAAWLMSAWHRTYSSCMSEEPRWGYSFLPSTWATPLVQLCPDLSFKVCSCLQSAPSSLAMQLRGRGELTLEQGLGWRWTSWICSIISGLNLVGIVFCFPETRYTRSIDSVSAVGPPSTIPDLADEKDISSTGIEKADDGETIVLEHANTTSSVVLTGTKNTYWQELKLWSSPTEHSFLNHLIRPFPLLAYPAVAWAVLTCKLSLPRTCLGT